jgi:hypothetical protein
MMSPDRSDHGIYTEVGLRVMDGDLCSGPTGLEFHPAVVCACEDGRLFLGGYASRCWRWKDGHGVDTKSLGRISLVLSLKLWEERERGSMRRLKRDRVRISSTLNSKSVSRSLYPASEDDNLCMMSTPVPPSSEQIPPRSQSPGPQPPPSVLHWPPVREKRRLRRWSGLTEGVDRERGLKKGSWFDVDCGNANGYVD